MTEPISIFDLRRKTKLVALNGGDHSVQVTGLTARQICDHLERFPILSAMSVGGSFTLPDLLKGTPGATAAWVASSLGHHANVEAEKAAEENLTIEDVAFIIEESMALTFSRGFGPFVARLAVVMGSLTGSPGRDQDTKLPTPSPPSGSTSEPGTSPPGN